MLYGVEKKETNAENQRSMNFNEFVLILSYIPPYIKFTYILNNEIVRFNLFLQNKISKNFRRYTDITTIISFVSPFHCSLKEHR